jgi:hypothetical protein
MKVNFWHEDEKTPFAAIEWTGQRFIKYGDIEYLNRKIDEPLPQIDPPTPGRLTMIHARATPELWLRNLPINYRGSYMWCELVDHQPDLPGL